MTPVARLRAIAERIATTRTALVGPTGYLDEPLDHPEATLMKGADPHGRIFITLCVRSTGRDDRTTYESCGVVTIFQRYSTQDLVTQASNSSNAPNLIAGAATDVDFDRLEELIERGEVSRTIEGVIGGTLHEHFSLVSPDIAALAFDVES